MCDVDVCRICLNTDVRGYKLGQHNLRNYYEQLTRKKVRFVQFLWLKTFTFLLMLF